MILTFLLLILVVVLVFFFSDWSGTYKGAEQKLNDESTQLSITNATLVKQAYTSGSCSDNCPDLKKTYSIIPAVAASFQASLVSSLTSAGYRVDDSAGPILISGFKPDYDITIQLLNSHEAVGASKETLVDTMIIDFYYHPGSKG